LRGKDEEKASFEYCYGAEYLLKESYWEDILKLKAQSSILVVLRTYAYDSQYSCQKEFLWAESNGMQILVVDARKEQYHNSTLLPFDVAPSIRLYDGNLIRVVLHAMSAHLRVLRIESTTVNENLKVLPHRPSVYSLSNIVREGTWNKIVYSAPKVPDEYKNAVMPIFTVIGQETMLVSFNELE